MILQRLLVHLGGESRLRWSYIAPVADLHGINEMLM
jgi:hypothetical protein